MLFLDTECYPNYWLCAFDDGTYFEYPFDCNALAAKLRSDDVCTFNGLAYDFPMIEAALRGASPMQLKQLNDRMIVEGEKVWHRLDWIRHVDLFNVLPGTGSLKAYGAKNHTKKLQDLPYDAGTVLTPAQKIEVRNYCLNDIKVLKELYFKFESQIQLRRDMSEEFSIDLMSKSDPQMAEAVVRSKFRFDMFDQCTIIYYTAPIWVSNPAIRACFEGMYEYGGEKPSKTIDLHGKTYTCGVGGLHSNEGRREVKGRGIFDVDVASYYPSLLLNFDTKPPRIKGAFLELYRQWYFERLAAKNKGDKKKADSLKTLLNGVFGKLGSSYSIFYYPKGFLDITLGGQCALLTLIDMLGQVRIEVISANTDGITVDTERELDMRRIVKEWELLTNLTMEFTEYRHLLNRDVNSYIAIGVDSKAKQKGVFALAEPGPSSWPNPTGQIVSTALVNFLRDNIPIEQTIRCCTDIREFLYVRAVKGGGSFVPGPNMPKNISKKKMIIPKFYLEVRDWHLSQKQYLGKTVRWYYSKDSNRSGTIRTPSDGLVAGSEGCRPLMDLPNSLPDDIDYQAYIDIAKGFLV